MDAISDAGIDVGSLTVDDLAPLDQFHGGGLTLTRRLARLAAFAPGAWVLDVGGGLGGPARTIALESGCHVTVLDLSPSYVDTGRRLTALMGLEDRVDFVVGDALDLPFGDGAFDAVWTVNSGMNIADKERLYAGFRRVVRDGGTLAIQEPMAGPGGPTIFPTMWATSQESSHLRTEAAMRDVITASGFRATAWDVIVPRRGGSTGRVTGTIQEIVMGSERVAEIAAASRLNEEDGRIVLVQAVFDG